MEMQQQQQQGRDSLPLSLTMDHHQNARNSNSDNNQKDLHQKTKLVVHVAESGRSIELACPPAAPVELLQTWLAPLSSVPPHDQLLICDDARLDPRRSLASYKLPHQDRHVFLFNRIRLLPHASPPPPEQVQLPHPTLPPPPSAASPCGVHPLEGAAPDPALRALLLYLKQFKYHYQKGHALFNASYDTYEACLRLHRELRVQNQALDTAKKNMEHYYKLVDHFYGEFMRQYTKQEKQHGDILVNFDRDLERLSHCQLHPSLLSDGKSTLLDCLDVASLRELLDFCASSNKQFRIKVQQLKPMYLELQQGVKELLCTVASVNFHCLEKMLTKCAHIIEEEGNIVQSLCKDVETVKKLVNDDANSNLFVSMQSRDATSALGPMYDVHDKDHLPQVEACYQRLGRVLEDFMSNKREMSMCVHTSMQKVAALQSTSRDMRNRITAFREVILHQDELFSELKLVRRIGPAYRACLAEIIRRKSDMKIYMGQAGQLAERMARLREAEVARREEFLRVQSKYISQDILVSMGLLGIPSQCLVNIEPYDTNLPDLDMKDLEKYAPESIVVPHLKGVVTGTTLQEERPFSVSKGSSSLFGSVDNSITNSDYNMKSAAAEDVTSEKIAGTSKLEVENAWPKAELASVIALLCSINPEFDAAISNDSSKESEVKGLGSNASQKMIQALALKDKHAKHLEGMLKATQLQCTSYEKRIRELEQRLSDQYMELHKLCVDGTDMRVQCGRSTDAHCEQSIGSGDGGLQNTAGPIESTHDRVSSSYIVDVQQSYPCNGTTGNRQAGEFWEGGDETMSDLSSGGPVSDMAAADDQRQEQAHLAGTNASERAVLGFILDQRQASLQGSSYGDEVLSVEVSRTKDEQSMSLQKALLQKENECAAIKERLQAALNEADSLKRELQTNARLLDECQRNCAELETCLHLAREEAQTKKCSADRKAAEYNSLRASSVKLHGLVERLRQSVSASPASTHFEGSLQSFAASLASDDTDDDGTMEFRACIRVLAERIGWLAQQRIKLQEQSSHVEASKTQPTTELAELLKSPHAKCKADKQVLMDGT